MTQQNMFESVPYPKGTLVMWGGNIRALVVEVVSTSHRKIEYTEEGELEPTTAIVPYAGLSKLDPYTQVETAEPPAPGTPIPPRDPSKPLSEDEKAAALRDILDYPEPDMTPEQVAELSNLVAPREPKAAPALLEDDPDDVSEADAYREALEAVRRELEAAKLENQRLAAENKLYGERAKKAEDEAAKQAFKEVDHWKRQAETWKHAAEEATKSYAALVNNAPKTITKYKIERGVASHHLEQWVADGWEPQTMQFVPTTSEYDGMLRTDLCVVFTKTLQIPDQPQVPASTTAVLTGDFVQEQILHRDPDPVPQPSMQMPTPEVNRMTDAKARRDLLYRRRAAIQGKEKAALNTIIIPAAKAKKVREGFRRDFPIATQIIEQGKDAVLDQMDLQVQQAFKAAYQQSIGAPAQAFTPLLPISE